MELIEVMEDGGESAAYKTPPRATHFTKRGPGRNGMQDECDEALYNDDDQGMSAGDLSGSKHENKVNAFVGCCAVGDSVHTARCCALGSRE